MKNNLNVETFRQSARIAAIAVAVALCSCASIMHGTHQDVGISSNPTGAQVTIDGQVKGMTPVVANLTRKDNHIVRIELPGYKPFETTLTRKTSGWVWGNIAFGGLIGLAVDAIDGGLYNLTPEQISGQMLVTNARVVPSKDGIYVAVVLAAQPEWQKVGQLSHD